MRSIGLSLTALFMSAVLLPPPARAQAPVFQVTPEASKVSFHVKSSMDLTGVFDKWKASLTFTSPDVNTGVLDLEIQADSVNTGSGMKNGKLKDKDFFDAKEFPLISFKSTGITQTGDNTFDIPGNFTIRGVSKPETLHLTVSGIGKGAGEIVGTMAFDRKDYGMNKNIPFMKIADRVEVTVDITAKRISGPPVNLKKP
jgi:polyisoprenoid-binding protein YceI